MDSVKVTAADFNGESWDGCPFDKVPDWLKAAVESGSIRVKGDDRDYALWSVDTPAGVVVAEPDDRIIRQPDGSFLVDRRVQPRYPMPSRRVC